jgi:Zn-dependent protease with chaperone function
MGPFLGAIIAAFLATLALDLGRTSDPVDRTTPTVLAIGMIVFAWGSSRLHHARQRGGRTPPPIWVRPFDLFAYWLLLFQTDWTTVAREATLDLPLLRHLMTLAPYLLAALARVDAAVPPESEESEERPGAWSRSRIVGFHARLLLIPILPLLLINGVRDAVASIGAARKLFFAYPVAEYALLGVLFVVALTFMPKLLAWLLLAKPLAAGPLRESLEQDLARQKVRIGGIDEVDTGGLVANAAYLGLSTRLGRIFISDALLHAMPPDEIRAVFAHEVAHGTRRHLVWIFLLFMGMLFCTYIGQDFLSERTVRGFVGPEARASTVYNVLNTALIVGMLLPLVAGLVAFVGISRRFEVEADLAASETLGDPELFSRALLRVGMIAGKPLDRHGMRHFSIALRTAIVRAAAVDPAERGRWIRRIHASKLAIAALCALVAAGVAWKLPHDLDLGHAKSALVAAGPDHPRDLARLREAAGHARAALGSASTRNEAAVFGIQASMGVIDELLRRGGPGDFDEARAIAQDVEKNWPSGDLAGDFNRKMVRLELAAIDPARNLAELRPDVEAAQRELEELASAFGRNKSMEECEQELRFLAAASVAGGAFEYEAESFESSRLLSLLRGRQPSGAETREARTVEEKWLNDAAWHRVVLERALGGRKPKEVLEGLVAADTRRSDR